VHLSGLPAEGHSYEHWGKLKDSDCERPPAYFTACAFDLHEFFEFTPGVEYDVEGRNWLAKQAYMSLLVRAAMKW
jgi:hypothetical protein